jgi:hypothetical protein
MVNLKAFIFSDLECAVRMSQAFDLPENSQ